MCIRDSLSDQLVVDLLPGDISSKRSRYRYSYHDKANIIQKYLEALNSDSQLSMSIFAKEANISKSMLYKWLKDKETIFRKSELETMKSEDPLSFLE